MVVDKGSVCSCDYARADTSLAYIHGAETPTQKPIYIYKIVIIVKSSFHATCTLVVTSPAIHEVGLHGCDPVDAEEHVVELAGAHVGCEIDRRIQTRIQTRSRAVVSAVRPLRTHTHTHTTCGFEMGFASQQPQVLVEKTELKWT